MFTRRISWSKPKGFKTKKTSGVTQPEVKAHEPKGSLIQVWEPKNQTVGPLTSKDRGRISWLWEKEQEFTLPPPFLSIWPMAEWILPTTLKVDSSLGALTPTPVSPRNTITDTMRTALSFSPMQTIFQQRTDGLSGYWSPEISNPLPTVPESFTLVRLKPTLTHHRLCLALF